MMVFNNTTTIFIPESIKNLSGLDVVYSFPNLINGTEEPYTILYAFSIDKVNYSNFKSKEDLQSELEELPVEDFYIAIKLFHKPLTTHTVSTIYQNHVIEESYPIEIECIKYDGVELTDYDSIDEDRQISNYPLWNFYNNQNVTIKRWIAQCNAMAQMYGHPCIYFKTQPVEINKTLLHTHTREVCDVKKIMINFPNNEIGNPDKIIYSDWDIPLADDLICQIVWDMFQRAFGEGVIPNEKDYIYLPLLNKMYRISNVQPINKFMGKIGWFEASLVKYEEDEAISIKQSAVDELGNIPEFESILNQATSGNFLKIDGDEDLEQYNGNPVEQTEQHVSDNNRTTERIEQSTVIEKREATDNYANKLVDSTKYTSVRESEKFRQFYDKRLEIVQVNPSEQTFPVNMYDNTGVNHNTVAMQYKLMDFTEVSHHNTTPKKSFKLCLNIVLIQKFGGEVISLLNENGSLQLCSIYIERPRFPKINFRFDISSEQPKKQLDFDLEFNELYEICIEYNIQSNQFSFKINQLVDSIKKLVFNDILIVTETSIPTIGYIQLYGGKMLTSNITLEVDDKLIIRDTCQPFLDMKNFGIE